MAQVADAEVRLFHLYVHEPLMRSGATGIEIAEEMLELTRELLPLASPVMDTCTSATCSTSSSRTWSATWRPTSTASAVDLGRTARRDRVRRPRRLHAPDRGGRASSRRSTPSSGSSRRSRRSLPDERARDQDDRRRGDDRRLRPGRADRLGGRLPAARVTSGRCRGSGSTTASRSTATATTTGATSTSPRAWPRARAAGEVLVTRPVVEHRRGRTSSSSGSPRSG